MFNNEGIEESGSACERGLLEFVFAIATGLTYPTYDLFANKNLLPHITRLKNQRRLSSSLSYVTFRGRMHFYSY